ncbi:Phosphomethylpyrimidine kinase-domain-containing protein [Zychaea mexicana]|uniref:Phosphomethylpyrimidine kinase-domain-containing protein n=1 Tax=Zychaea mexicana TaxID=64656 RepID=UPI0022FE0EB0|nr:Phosphomethylpyrimidine kinase-domain-containing protein [Zychaea mexicana]KAI9484966.1 Phosphomethylpyrimidine kinase-domain-containing protein [Zychaea mexicana]
MTAIPKVLTIAGSDSGGGAGIQADIKTLTSLNVYGSSVLTSLTSQNTLGVDGIHDVPTDFVRKQLEAVLSDIGTDAIKMGMLSSCAIIRTIVETLKKYPYDKLVVDPVMISTSGSKLLADDAIQTFINELLPITMVLTPNVPEAEVLLGKATGSIKTLEDVREAAKQIGALGPKFVLVKGGHLPQEINGQKKVVDVLYESATGAFDDIVNPYLDTKDTHGTGCTLSAAIAGELAKGQDVLGSVKSATTYVQDAIVSCLDSLGKGAGPVNHFHNIHARPYSGNSFVKALVQSLPEGLWDEFIDHPFVRGMADGTLPRESFIYYLKQDYLYLQHYARSAALAAYKSPNIDMAARNAKIIMHIQEEMQMHLKYCEEWGISKEDILTTKESVYNVAYTRYVLDKGATGDQLDLQVAMAPCLLGYGDIGVNLYNDPNTKRELLEELAIHNVSTSPSRFKEVCEIFEQGTRLEIAFWQMGLDRK